jgi:hypothetical protein
MSFTADLSRFHKMTDERLRRVIVRSVADIMSGAQLKTPGVMLGATIKTGRMPFYTTALVTSLVSISGGGEFRGEFSYDSALARYTLGDPLRFYWDQPYANYIENGDENFPGWHFMKTNAARWSDVVLANARKMRNRAA